MINPTSDVARKDDWIQTIRMWGDSRKARETAYVTPALPFAWRQDDPVFGGLCVDLDRIVESLIVESVRHRALDGDRVAQSLCFRTVEAPARSIPVAPSRVIEPALLPTEVADAMIQAGLTALDYAVPNIPPPASRRCPPPLPLPPRLESYLPIPSRPAFTSLPFLHP